MQKEFQTYDVLGIPISVTTLDTARDALIRWSQDDQGRCVGVREIASVMALRETDDLLELSRKTAMNVPDGKPLVWIGRARGHAVERTCGPDLMEKMMLEGPENGLKHFFYGGKEGVADTLVKRFQDRAPGVQIVGTYCPPFRPLTPEEDADVVAQIRDSGADIVWVGISSPKQDVWMQDHVDQLPVTMIGVGAAFDFHSGEVKRAPKIMQHYGLEWLHRLLSEPKRLWRRYLIHAPIFVWLVLTTSGSKDK